MRSCSIFNLNSVFKIKVTEGRLWIRLPSRRAATSEAEGLPSQKRKKVRVCWTFFGIVYTAIYLKYTLLLLPHNIGSHRSRVFSPPMTPGTACLMSRSKVVEALGMIPLTQKNLSQTLLQRTLSRTLPRLLPQTPAYLWHHLRSNPISIGYGFC